MREKILILDANSILYRAFHALPPLTNKKGELVNAVYGFLLVFFRAVKEFKPDYVISCFDLPAPTFRHYQFQEYKASRPPTPLELISQIPKIKEILSVLAVTILEKEGYEADDLIGTIVKNFSQKEKIIVSGDSDVLQLLDPKTKVYFLKKSVKNALLYDEKLLEKEMGLKPSQLVDFKSLTGDPSDNVPGAKGIGKKTAFRLIKEFENLENIYKNIEKIPPLLKEKLLASKEKVFLGKAIIQIKKDALEKVELKYFQKFKIEEVVDILQKYGFKSLIKRVSELKENRLF